MTVRALFHLTLSHRGSLGALIVLTVLSSLVMLAVPWLAAQILSGILFAQASMGYLMAVLLAALVVLAALNILTSAISSATAARLLGELRVKIYAHLQALPVGFHNDRRHGDILALATFEVSRLGHFMTGTFVSFPSRILTAVGAVILMLRIDAQIALLVPILVPAFYLVLKIVGRRLRQLAKSAQQAEAGVIATIGRNLAMIPAIKSFAREAAEASFYRRKVETSMALAIQQGRINAALQPLVGLVAASATALLLYTAGQNVKSGAMSSVELFSFLFYAALLTRPVSALAHIYGEVQSARGTLERLESVLNERAEPGYSGRIPLLTTRGDISFAGVSFSYLGRGPVLREVTLDIKAGEKVAFIGDNGAGKTSLVNLLLRFIDPELGSIRLDGQDISLLDVQDLRRRIGVVPQHAALFNGTIRANIAFGLETANDKQVTRAATLAQAHEFIAALPDGYDTQIGDHGVRLSGGQRQRVSLARALVKDPPILILDEATSMFDLDGELAFIEALSSALDGRTVLLITHRPASLAIADRVISVERGSVREVVRVSACDVAVSIQ